MGFSQFAVIDIYRLVIIFMHFLLCGDYTLELLNISFEYWLSD